MATFFHNLQKKKKKWKQPSGPLIDKSSIKLVYIYIIKTIQ